VQSERWMRIERLFADALALPALSRHAYLIRACGDDSDLLRELEELVHAHDTPGVLDAAPRAGDSPAIDPSLAAGTGIGAWRIENLIGRGGMGEVYAATRIDAAFEQRAALKLLRHEAAGQLERFHAERRILARLEHPGIARLLDGGIATDGRPYTVMEFVEGHPITHHCRTHRSSLRDRLALFAQVCEAVAFAHRNLVIHRDLKPDNIFVNAHGDVKLLDFGIAKLLDVAGLPREADNTIAPFTPDYAAPEQLSGEPVTTATDIYALGVLLFELLTGERPLRTRGLPSTHAMKLILDRSAPAPSRTAQASDAPPLPARLLSGDLDAIVAKCLRKEANHRYETVNGLKRDLDAHLRNEPVLAREGAHVYVLGRLLRRYRWGVAAVCALILSLAAGLAGTIWQARRAEAQAARANATKDFLLGVFKASDPRIASDKPRGEITARELLDLSSARIEKEFAAQPDLQIELLGLTAAIYGNLLDEERHAAMLKRRMELARSNYGSSHPIVIESLIDEADSACFRQDHAKANRLLDEADGLLETSGGDGGVLRAHWWRVKARALGAVAGARTERNHALSQALALYAKLAPRSNEYAEALNMAARDHAERGEHVQSRQLMEQTLEVAEAAPIRNDGQIAIYVNNLARKYERLGEFDAAESAYDRAEELARRTFGERTDMFWMTRASHALMLHQRGQRERANRLFEQTLPLIPNEWTTNTNDTSVREKYAECLAAEGRAKEAIPLLEAALEVYTAKLQYESDLREVRRKLGDAYDRAGRTDEARTMLRSSRDEFLEKEALDSPWALRIRERWARFVLDHAQSGGADLTAAETEFRSVLDLAGERPLPESALAHAGLARIAGMRGNTADALQESRLALVALERVQGLYDLRLQPQVWLVHGNVLRESGDSAGAREWSGKALHAIRQYDDASSPAIASAEAAVRDAMAASVR